MSGILWACLGTAIGLLAAFLIRAWAGRTGEAGGTPRSAARQHPKAARIRTPVPPPVRSPTGINRKQTRKFHGVSVRPGLQSCNAVQALGGQRFLPDEAPAMPLAGCDQARCQCSYAHHGDRRDQGERRSGWGSFGGFAPSIPGGNRRGKDQDRDRRQS